MAKKLLATLLATLMLLGVFAVAASATNDFSATTEESQRIFGEPSRDRVPNGITNRYDRYRDIARGASLSVRAEVNVTAARFTADIARAETQLQLNQALNQRNNAMASVLRNAGELNVFSAFFSWFGGNFWWLWAPIAAVVVGVGAWFFFMG
ncbi:MAG: hypothetical protein FWE40_07115 [Oscillospiraceae bacterium]|nr:hypothetical protein [Oscillospiraceae bacterium]